MNQRQIKDNWTEEKIRNINSALETTPSFFDAVDFCKSTGRWADKDAESIPDWTLDGFPMGEDMGIDASFGYGADRNRLDRSTIGEEGHFINGRCFVAHEPAPVYKPQAHHRIENHMATFGLDALTAQRLVDAIKALELSARDFFTLSRANGETRNGIAILDELETLAAELAKVTFDRPVSHDDLETYEAPEQTPPAVCYHRLFDGDEPGMDETQIQALKDQKEISALRKFRKMLYSGDLRQIIPDRTATTQAFNFSQDRINALLRKTAETAPIDVCFWLTRINEAKPEKFKIIKAFLATITSGKVFDWRGKKISLKLTPNESALLWSCFNARQRAAK